MLSSLFSRSTPTLSEAITSELEVVKRGRDVAEKLGAERRALKIIDDNISRAADESLSERRRCELLEYALSHTNGELLRRLTHNSAPLSEITEFFIKLHEKCQNRGQQIT